MTAASARKDGYDLRMKKMGLDDEKVVIWEPLKIIRDDIPGVFENFLQTSETAI